MGSEQIMIQDDVSQQIIASAEKLAKQKSADKITVRDILKDLQITNRVFYNRFHNINEVLDILYHQMIHKVRESLNRPTDANTDFFQHVKNVAIHTLILSYTYKENLSQFVFETDSSSHENLHWWCSEITRLIQLGQSQGVLKKDLDCETLSYSIWCFIRGFNADAMSRNLSLEEASRRFDYGFGIFLDGMRP